MKYYFIVATKDFLFREEPLEEVLRERASYYQSQQKSNDFWIVPNPEFINNYSEEFKKFLQPSSESIVSVVSTDKDFIYWLKLRYQNVASGHFNAPTHNILSPLAYN
jgi:hypothetical protein